MIPEIIHSLPLPDLIDLLIENMEELHSLSHQRVTDGIMIRDKKFDVQLIQTVIGNKKVEIMPEDMQLA